MKIDVLYSYTENVIPPRCRNARRTNFDSGIVVVDVREIPPEQAPVALVHTQYGYDMETIQGTAEYRWFEDRLWINKSVGHDFGKAFGSAPARVIDARKSGKHSSMNESYRSSEECQQRFQE